MNAYPAPMDSEMLERRFCPMYAVHGAANIDSHAPRKGLCFRDIDLKPTAEMARLAARGLELRDEFNRGGTAVGVARARDISNRASLSPDTVRRMKSFFARHRVDLDAEGAKPNQEGWPSAGAIAWMLWGGDPSDPDGAGAAWANRKSDELSAEEDERSAKTQARGYGIDEEDDEYDRGGFALLRGYASTWSDEYMVSGVTESVQAGAFARSLRERPDVFALLGHDMNRVVARTKNNSLRLREDRNGLMVEIEQIDTQDSRAAFDLVRTGTIDAMSFGFTIREQKLTTNGGAIQRVLTDVDLYEVSLVAMPANPNATVSASARALTRTLAVRLSPFIAVPPITRRSHVNH